MIRLLASAFVALLLTAAIAVAQAPQRSVNVTADSAPGWIPSVELEQAAADAVRDYFSAKDEGRYADAYARLAALQRQHLTLEAFTSAARDANALAGAVREHRTLRMTWTKDPARAPRPGVYAAVDIASRYENIDRSCGYLVLYQAPEGGAFSVMREEFNYLDNSTAARIEREHSRAALDQTWAQLSANCPNYEP